MMGRLKLDGRTGTGFPAAFLALSLTTTPIMAQNRESDELTKLEARIAAGEEQLKAMRAELEDLKRRMPAPAIAPVAQPPQQADAVVTKLRLEGTKRYPICAMRDAKELEKALAGRGVDENDKGAEFWPDFDRCLGRTLVSTDPLLDGKEIKAIAPGGLDVPTGVSAKLEFAKGQSDASLSLGLPIVWRNVYTAGNEFRGFAPQTGNFGVTLKTPLSKESLGTLLDNRKRKRDDDLNVLDGTTIKFGFDFLQFARRRYPNPRVAGDARRYADEPVYDVLFEAYKKCAKSETAPRDGFVAYYRTGEQGDLSQGCLGTQLVEYIAAGTANAADANYYALTRPELAARYENAFWKAPETEVPLWGWGVSGELGRPSFAFEQAAYAANTDDGIRRKATIDDPERPFELGFDATQALAAKKTTDKLDWKLNAYGLLNIEADDERDGKVPAIRKRFDVPHVGLVASLSHGRAWSLRDGAKDQSICAPPASTVTSPPPAFVRNSCRTTNLDRPYSRETTQVAFEVRARMDLVPLVGSVGIAPKATYRLDDDRKQFDLPLFVALDKEAKNWAGIKLRRQYGGIDSIGNAEADFTDVSIFFTALNFSGQ